MPPNSSYKPVTDTAAYVAGWGTLSSGGKAPDLLQNVKVTYYVSGTQCERYSGLDFEKQICAGEVRGGKDSCQGDSGGPLYVKEGNKFLVVGVVSFGNGCARAGYPG
jgi:trypsin